MSLTVDADSRSPLSFAPAEVGKALATFWSAHGLTMQMIPNESHGETCPISMDAITSAGLTGDGHMYQMGFILDWLRSHNTSPRTNMDLPHKHILRLSALKEIVSHYLVASTASMDATRAKTELQARNAVHGASEMTFNQL